MGHVLWSLELVFLIKPCLLTYKSNKPCRYIYPVESVGVIKTDLLFVQGFAGWRIDLNSFYL